MDIPRPFVFPSATPERKHGPAGYADYREYKDWLRDEFVFRCVYCLEREAWHPHRGAAFAVEHILPQSTRPDLICEYDNLAYACLRCNSLKQDAETLDPSRVALGEHVSVQSDGAIVALTDEGREFVALFRLDLPPATDVRKAKLWILSLKSRYPGDPEVEQLFRSEFGYPADLPDLRPPAKRPQSNSRPDGVKSCHFVRRLDGKLADVY
jgi:hypothetical protein